MILISVSKKVGRKTRETKGSVWKEQEKGVCLPFVRFGTRPREFTPGRPSRIRIPL